MDEKLSENADSNVNKVESEEQNSTEIGDEQDDDDTLVSSSLTSVEEPTIQDLNDEDDIHPLARTTVKASPKTSVGQIQVENHKDNSISICNKDNNKSAEAQKRINKPSVVSKKQPISDLTLSSDLNLRLPKLPLPSHMSVLMANFKALENVLFFTKKQGQLCFYHKIKKHVELQSAR
jgi:hypothetical protein